ncbi:hypothetical protein PanWU01x14_312740 [Parasponia andersonii]|uniref:Uncharacterized protein n=1 Tax=Parasponia andersonii TaxID=3476 RepID=A0A2P5APB9_PARAD|nr:hypothetical protein PanWU01x14_312740 [Parasponia andersonii]
MFSALTTSTLLFAISEINQSKIINFSINLFPGKAGGFTNRSHLKSRLLDRISKKFPGKTWRGHSCFLFKPGLLRQNTNSPPQEFHTKNNSNNKAAEQYIYSNN